MFALEVQKLAMKCSRQMFHLLCKENDVGMHDKKYTYRNSVVTRDKVAWLDQLLVKTFHNSEFSTMGTYNIYCIECTG